MRILLAGQDITSYVTNQAVSNLPDIQIESVLGQGPGSGAATSGRAATATFGVNLGPLATAGGAGTAVHTPTLVRMGEVQIYDNSNVLLFGGYASKFSDKTSTLRTYTQVDCYDYWQHLDRVMVNEVLDGVTDIGVISFLIGKYAPWINLSLLPSTVSYTFTLLNCRNKSLQKSLQQIATTTGLLIWISPDKKLHYEGVPQAPTAPFGLSDSPDFRGYFNGSVDTYEVDDTAAINQVTFYGGKKVSNDFTQDLSSQANGVNTTFFFAYYAHKASDGNYHVKVNNGADLSVGFANGSGASNTLRSAGGSADVLINSDAHTLTFNTAPAAGATVTFKYRYEQPLVVVVPDQASIKYYGMTLGATISDETILDPQTAAKRCRVLLLDQSRGLTTLKLKCWKAGLQAGQLLPVRFNKVRKLTNTFIIQKVTMSPLGAGNWQYLVECGAWDWNLIDLVLRAAVASRPADTSQSETTDTVVVQDAYDNLSIHDSFTKVIRGGPYYARATALNDGSDAYAGFAYVTS